MHRAALLALLCIPATLPAWAKEPMALVIGNSAYQHTAMLANPVIDATAIGAALRDLGFDVDVRTDLTLAAMQAALRAFGDRLQGASAGLFFYAGHGVQVNGANYLMPVDARLERERDLPYELLDIGLVLREMEAGRRVNLVFLDACRDNPLASRMSTTGGGRSAGGRGLARIDASTGTLISFATRDGEIAADGHGRHSPYTSALLKHLKTPGLEVGLMLRRVRQDVLDATGGEQTPWDYGSLLGEFYFKPGTGAGAPSGPASGGSPPDVAALAFSAIANSGSPADFEIFAKSFSASPLAAVANQRAASLRAQHQTAMVAPTATVPSKDMDLRQETRPAHGGFIFPDSDSRYLRRDELVRLSRTELRIARNEIYARKGRYFKDPDLQRHFSQFAWYRPTTWDPPISSIEGANVRLIKQMETTP